MNSREVKLLIQKNASQKLLSEKIINGEDNYLRITQAIASDPSSLPLSASLLTALQRWKLDKFEAHESSDTIETDDIVMISKILAEVLNILNPLLRPQLQRVVDISQGAVGAVDGSESCELFDDATATSTLHNTLQQKEGFISVIRLCVIVHIMAMTMFILYDEILPTAVVDDLKAINGALSDSFVSLMTCNQVFKKDRDVISQWISAQLVYAAHRHKSNLADFSGNKIVISILAVFSTEILQESSIKGVYTFCSTMHILAPQVKLYFFT